MPHILVLSERILDFALLVKSKMAAICARLKQEIDIIFDKMEADELHDL